VITATNFVTQSNDQGEAVTDQQVGTVVVTATGEGDEQRELSLFGRESIANVKSPLQTPMPQLRLTRWSLSLRH